MNQLIKVKRQLAKNNELVKNNIDEFEKIMNLYQKGMDELVTEFNKIKELLNMYYRKNTVTNVSCRLKDLNSITSKMKKKGYKLEVNTMIEKINDIAGIRIVCTYKDDIYIIKDIISNMKNVKIIKEKDYIKNVKKSGYSAYHLILEVPVKVEEQTVFVKAEVQIRTMLMDFWSETEHKVKYKANRQISKADSIRLKIYAKIINFIGDNIMKIDRKQNRISY